MKIHVLELGVLGANCYLLDNEEKNCIAIDIGGSFATVSDYLDKHELNLSAIFLTHGHFDHIAGVQAAVDRFGCPVYIHEEDAAMLSDNEENLAASCGIRISTVTNAKIITFKNNDVFSISGIDLKIMHTPGHSPGSSCILCENYIFSGDTLFCESIGRTDFPGSDSIKMRESLLRLSEIEGNPTVYPGHGEHTTLEMEKKFNPYFI